MLELELLKNIKTFLASADLVYNTKDFTSAAILYFKALFASLDYLILAKVGQTPKDHEERFRILETKFPSLYKILNDVFRIYRASYRTTISQTDCEKVRSHVKETIERYKIKGY